MDVNKTKIPINLPNINNDLFFSFFVGIVDADGCIEIRNNKAKTLKIELYHTWYDNLLKISNFLKDYLNIPSKVIINKRGYSLFRITGHKNILKIKQKINDLEIKPMIRKWELISENIYGCDFYREIEGDVIKLYKEGNNLTKISKLLDVNYSSLANHKKEIVLKSK